MKNSAQHLPAQDFGQTGQVMARLTPSRAESLTQLRDNSRWDVVIIGGGATGLGSAVDAAARGYRTLLIERLDFASGTSSRSTKLIHGGVRYLRQGNLTLVRDALRERAYLLHNAPHLVQPLAFVIPAGNQFERLFYGAGLKLYDRLAGSHGMPASALLDREQTLSALPGLSAAGIAGGIQYWDGQFDDARLAVTLMRSANDLGATCLNYLPASGLIKNQGRICGVLATDSESGEHFEIGARVVINATGVYADSVRRFDEPDSAPILTPSQGIHLVLDADFLPGNHALMIPKTDDGRVMFVIPWQGKLLLGTTDSERHDLPDEPQPLAEEIDFLLRSAGRALKRQPQRSDIRSAFAGLRPLLHAKKSSRQTASLSREHAVLLSASGLLTVSGGKWTTYRLMAEQVINQAALSAGLEAVPCRTARLRLHGWSDEAQAGAYGSDAPLLASLPGYRRRLHPELTLDEAEVRFAIRYEAARTIEDILARRNRALFLNAFAAAECIAAVGEILAQELTLDASRHASLIATAQAGARHFQLTG